jgi:predicted DNA-binding protein with PD1-like motif
MPLGEVFVAEATAGQRRVVHHPGVPAPCRCRTHAAPAADEFELWLAPGQVLFDAIVEALASRGVHHANLQIFDGDLTEARYQTAPPDPRGELVVAYGPPIDLNGGACIVMASATLGRTADGKPIIHCHGILRDRTGRLCGGHIPTNLCTVGVSGVSAWAVVSHDGGFVVGPDSETGFSLLSPQDDET